MEMQVVHYAKPDDLEGDPTGGNEIFASVIGVLFTSNKDEATELSNAAQAALENFYESLEESALLEAAGVDWQVPLSNLMAVLDLENKWTYIGSFTTPPCTTRVYW